MQVVYINFVLLWLHVMLKIADSLYLNCNAIEKIQRNHILLVFMTQLRTEIFKNYKIS